MRILFAGSPAIALPSFRMITEGAKAALWTLAGVLTNPDKPRGRRCVPEPTEIGREAETAAGEFSRRGLLPPALLKPECLKAAARKAAGALRPDLLVTFAYGRIFGPQFLALFPLGGINVHPSLLPKYRGASPIQEAILRRDTVTGITIQRIAREMDAGNILAQKEIPLNGRETGGILGETAALEGAELLRLVLEELRRALPDGETAPGFPLKEIPQEGEPSYCPRIRADSALIDWSRSAGEIDALIRAYNPWPLARAGHNGRILYILEAAPLPDSAGPQCEPGEPGRVLGIHKKSGILVQTGSGVLAVSALQYQTKKALPWRDFLNGVRDFTGSRLTGGS